MNKYQEVITELKKFRDDRDWKQFHNPKDVALSLVLEATEVLEHFQWKTQQDIEKYIFKKKTILVKNLQMFCIG